MAWLMVIVSVFVMWISTLCKILHTARSSSKAAFLSNGGDPYKCYHTYCTFRHLLVYTSFPPISGGSFHQRNVLLVIAHPDDESMYALNYECLSNEALSVFYIELCNFFVGI